jgi:RNA polymerase-binding transcription factor DksA
MSKDEYENYAERKEAEFYKKYPLCFEGEPICGFYCGFGWWPLLDQLCADITKELELDTDLRDMFRVDQIKEKFGGLRFYTSAGNDAINKLIHEAEEKSYTICEDCGAPGKPRNTNWRKTRCDKCHEEFLSRKRVLDISVQMAQLWKSLGGHFSGERDMTQGPWCAKLRSLIEDRRITQFGFTPGPEFNNLSLEEAAKAVFEFITAPYDDVNDQEF